MLDSNDKQVKLKIEVGYPIQEVKNQLHALISQKIESDFNIEAIRHSTKNSVAQSAN